MPIISSKVVEDQPQVDGRRSIHELHVDHLGEIYDVFYMAAEKDDVSAVLATRATQIEDDLAAAELAANLLEASQP